MVDGPGLERARGTLGRGANPFSKEVAMEQDVQVFRTPTNTGDPIEVFFPDKDRIIAVYQKGYFSVFPADGRSGEWLASDLAGTTLGGMMRVRFWDAGACREKLLVEAYGSVGDVQEKRIDSQASVRIGPFRVVAICSFEAMTRWLALLRENGKEEIRVTGQIVAFCKEGPDMVAEFAIVRDKSRIGDGLWLRATNRGTERFVLPAKGEVEIGWDMAAILNSIGEVYLAKPSENVARLLADSVWAVGLSADGSRLVMLLQEPKGWFWDFRQTSEPQKIAYKLQATPLDRRGIPVRPIVLRISPDLRWAVAAVPEHVAVWRVPEVED
jgi:hypothetical protein